MFFSSFNFLKTEGVTTNYGDLNMYVMKQGKVVIVNSSNNDIRIGFVEEGYTMYQHDSSGLFTRNVAYQIRDFVERNEINCVADILYKNTNGNSFCPCINDVNYSEYCLLNDQDVDVVLNNEIWIMKREEEGNI